MTGDFYGNTITTWLQQADEIPQKELKGTDSKPGGQEVGVQVLHP